MALPPGPFASGKTVGGSGGDPFEEHRWIQDKSALVVKALSVWWNDTALRGIQVTYSDNLLSPVHGKAVGDQDGIVFEPSELVDSLTLWGNGRGTRVGHIRITTTAGKDWNAGIPTAGIRPYSMEIGSGLLVGMFGKAGLDIDRLGVLFLRTSVVSVAIDKVTPNPPIENGVSNFPSVGIEDGTFENTGEEEEPWVFQGSAERPWMMWYKQRSINTLGPNVEPTLSARIYVLNKDGSLQPGPPTFSPTVTLTHTLGWNESGTLNPGETIHRYANSRLGDLRNYKYDSMVTIKLEDGWTSTYPEDGLFSLVAFSDAWVTPGDK